MLLQLLKKLFSLFDTAGSRGRRGEQQVKRALGTTKAGEYYVITDLILPTEQGRTAQIDHVFICSHGVLAIETKNYSGRIYGNESQLQWTQVLSYGKEKHQFYNPLKQNATHIYQLRKVIDRATPILSAVVFVNGTLMKKNIPCVYSLQSFQNLIGELKRVKGTLTLDRMEKAYQALLKIKNTVTVTDKEHIQSIRQMKRDIAQNICPRCGSPLVERNGKNGIFLGCKGYPNCKFTKPKPTK